MPKGLYQVSLKAIIQREDGKVLGLNGKKGGLLEGYHDIPGGRVELEEFLLPFREVLIREVQEELGSVVRLTVSDTPVALGKHLSRDGHQILYIFFEASLEHADALLISSEHEGYAWLDVTMETLDTYFNIGIREGMGQWVASRKKT